MHSLDLLLRVAPATVLLLLGGLLLRDAKGQRIVRAFGLLSLGLAGFLAGNTPYPELLLPAPVATWAGLLSGLAALFLWWFLLELFDDGFALGPRQWAVSGAWLLLVLLDRGLLGARYAGIGLSWGLIAMALAMVAHVLWRLLRDREGDLVEERRRSRRWIAAAFSAALLADLGADILMGFSWKPAWFCLLQNAAIGAIALALARLLLRADARVLVHRLAEREAAEPSAARSQERENALLARIEQLMHEQRLYRDPELDFASFVKLAGAPEPEVRRLVNHRLGARHFRSFLNAYRLEDAKAALADPARARDKLLTIALDAGFASLSSFNRSFKQAQGESPSAYRARQLPETAAEPDLELPKTRF